MPHPTNEPATPAGAVPAREESLPDQAQHAPTAGALSSKHPVIDIAHMSTRTKWMLSGLAGLAGFAGTAWLGALTTLLARQHALIFNPIRSREVQRPVSAGHRTRPVVLRAEDGTRLCGWLLTPRQPGRHPAVIYFGGRSEEVSWVARDAGIMFPGMTVLAMNYRGYGNSQGSPGERQMIEDGKLLFDWLAAHHRVDPARIAAVGRSLGSGVAVQAAAQRPIAALALITPYDSILALAKRRFRTMPISLMLRHRFESINYASRVTAPVLVLRAAVDKIVPHAHTDLLVSKLSNVVIDQIVPDSNHLNIPYLPQTQERIAGFLQSRLGEEKAVAAPVMPGLVGAP